MLIRLMFMVFHFLSLTDKNKDHLAVHPPFGQSVSLFPINQPPLFQSSVEIAGSVAPSSPARPQVHENYLHWDSLRCPNEAHPPARRSSRSLWSQSSIYVQ